MSIILNHVNYVYEKGTPQERYALKDINLEICPGEFIGVIGHTGSGKSTLMQLLNGLIEPTGGLVLFNGQDISDRDFDKKMLRSKVGMVFQYPEYQLFETTVFEDVCFGPKNLGWERKKVEFRAYGALRKMHFPENLYYQSPFDLSGGQKRRAAIAGVLAMEPDYLILDEPTAGLDPQGRDEILNLIAELAQKENKAVLLVSHSMDDVANYVNRLLVMDNGRLVMDDSPHKIFARNKELEHIGLAVPQVTYIMNELQAHGLPVRTGATTMQEAKKEILRVMSRTSL